MLTSKLLSFEKGTNQTCFIDVSIKQIATDWAIMCQLNLNAVPAARQEKASNNYTFATICVTF